MKKHVLRAVDEQVALNAVRTRVELTDDQMARRIRSLLIDKTGDGDWAGVRLADVLGAVPFDVDAADFDAEKAADGVLEQCFEPHHFVLMKPTKG